MSVLIDHRSDLVPEAGRVPTHRAARLPRSVAVRLGVIALLLCAVVAASVTVTVAATAVLGATGGALGCVLAAAAGLVVRRQRDARAWHRELEAACGVHERRPLNLSRVL